MRAAMLSPGVVDFEVVHHATLAEAPDRPIVVMESPGEEEVAQATVEAGVVEFLIRGPAALQALSGVMLAATESE